MIAPSSDQGCAAMNESNRCAGITVVWNPQLKLERRNHRLVRQMVTDHTQRRSSPGGAPGPLNWTLARPDCVARCHGRPAPKSCRHGQIRLRVSARPKFCCASAGSTSTRGERSYQKWRSVPPAAATMQLPPPSRSWGAMLGASWSDRMIRRRTGKSCTLYGEIVRTRPRPPSFLMLRTPPTSWQCKAH
jgi:hypothetical protein